MDRRDRLGSAKAETLHTLAGSAPGANRYRAIMAGAAGQGSTKHSKKAARRKSAGRLMSRDWEKVALGGGEPKARLTEPGGRRKGSGADCNDAGPKAGE